MKSTISICILLVILVNLCIPLYSFPTDINTLKQHGRNESDIRTKKCINIENLWENLILKYFHRTVRLGIKPVTEEAGRLERICSHFKKSVEFHRHAVYQATFISKVLENIFDIINGNPGYAYNHDYVHRMDVVAKTLSLSSAELLNATTFCTTADNNVFTDVMTECDNLIRTYNFADSLREIIRTSISVQNKTFLMSRTKNNTINLDTIKNVLGEISVAKVNDNMWQATETVALSSTENMSLLTEIIKNAIPHFTVSCESNSTIVAYGNYFKISEVLSKIHRNQYTHSQQFVCDAKTLKKLFIFSSDTIIIDQSVRRTNGMEELYYVSVIAPRWVTTKNVQQEFNLRGRRGVAPDPETGGPGMDGKDGSPGEHGGIFFGLFAEVENLSHLVFHVEGGNGGDGQNGGNGVHGATGRWASLDEFPSPTSDMAFQPWTGNNRQVEFEKPGVYLRGQVRDYGTLSLGIPEDWEWYTITGFKGEKGGNGGNGGGGGSAGLSGKVTMFNVTSESQNPKPQFQIHAENGTAGKPGQGGKRGVEGYRGNNLSCCRNKGLGPPKWISCEHTYNRYVSKPRNGEPGKPGKTLDNSTNRPLTSLLTWQVINRYKSKFVESNLRMTPFSFQTFIENIDSKLELLDQFPPLYFAQELALIVQQAHINLNEPKWMYIHLYESFLRKLKNYENRRFPCHRKQSDSDTLLFSFVCSSVLNKLQSLRNLTAKETRIKENYMNTVISLPNAFVATMNDPFTNEIIRNLEIPVNIWEKHLIQTFYQDLHICASNANIDLMRNNCSEICERSWLFYIKTVNLNTQFAISKAIRSLIEDVIENSNHHVFDSVNLRKRHFIKSQCVQYFKMFRFSAELRKNLLHYSSQNILRDLITNASLVVHSDNILEILQNQALFNVSKDIQQAYENFSGPEHRQALLNIMQERIPWMKTKCENDSDLVVSGNIVRLSDIIESETCHEEKIKTLSVFASDVVFLDTSVYKAGSLTFLNDISIIAPKLVVVTRNLHGNGSKVVINLGGRNGYATNSTLSGEDGGNLTGVYSTIENAQYLSIIVTGGNGQNGEDGVDGRDGITGRNATLTDFQQTPYSWRYVPYFYGFVESAEPNSIYLGTVTKGVLHDNLTYESQLWRTMTGLVGGRGENGGTGGDAGHGGDQGTVEFFQVPLLQKKVDYLPFISVIRGKGRSGIPGKGGRPGIGGYRGNNLSCKFNFNNPQVSLLRDTCFSSANPRRHRYPDTSERQNSGTQGKDGGILNSPLHSKRQNSHILDDLVRKFIETFSPETNSTTSDSDESIFFRTELKAMLIKDFKLSTAI